MLLAATIPTTTAAAAGQTLCLRSLAAVPSRRRLLPKLFKMTSCGPVHRHTPFEYDSMCMHTTFSK